MTHHQMITCIYNLHKTMLGSVKEKPSPVLLTYINSAIHSDHIVFTTFRLLLKISTIIASCICLGHLIANLRNPYLITSTKQIFTDLKEFGIVRTAPRALKNFLLYGTIGLLIFGLLLWSTLKIIRSKITVQNKNSKPNKAIFFVITLLVLFYLLNILIFKQ